MKIRQLLRRYRTGFRLACLGVAIPILSVAQTSETPGQIDYFALQDSCLLPGPFYRTQRVDEAYT